MLNNWRQQDSSRLFDKANSPTWCCSATSSKLTWIICRKSCRKTEPFRGDPHQLMGIEVRRTDMSRLKNKVAVVTGASKGIGAGIAKSLAAEGASVVVNYASSKEGADRVVAEIVETGGKAVAVQGDVSKAADVQRLFAETKKAFGTLDVLVNNAGVYEFAALGEITEEQFHRQFNTNVLGLLLATQEAAKLFGPEGGSIINIGSTASHLTPATTVVYTATKGAVDAVTHVLAKELGPKKIRVNSINPGRSEERRVG